MKLVVGLGNIGRKYEGTRHNVGFASVMELARRFGRGVARSQFDGEVVEAELEGERALLLTPHTLMNRSGGSVVKAKEFYKLALDELLVICDDFNLPLAKLRIRDKGSAIFIGRGASPDVIEASAKAYLQAINKLVYHTGPAPGG